MPFSIVGRAQQTGNQFLRDKSGKYRWTLPEGVAQVQITYTGKGTLVTQLRYPSLPNSVRPSELQIAAGSEPRRSKMVDIPVHEAGVEIDFTATNLTAEDLNLPLLSVKILPLPPQPA